MSKLTSVVLAFRDRDTIILDAAGGTRLEAVGAPAAAA